ncbi:MAG: hypothetical protein GY943_29620 [Chloroflexi bacterium]|nr:hypothetical protein [Chloroflexota bacterium]
MMRNLIFVMLVSLLIAGCSNGNDAPILLSLHCTTAYRSSVAVGIEQEETTMINVTIVETVPYKDLTIEFRYDDGLESFESRSLLVNVTGEGFSDRLSSQLYQLTKTEAPLNQFVGGHGFTGLHYVTHPESGAELQYWCEVAE